jgi:hypothetical protein
MSHAFRRPDRKSVNAMTNTMVLFSDDFGGAVLDPNRWTVLDGGQGAVNLGEVSGPPSGLTAQGAIGSLITGMTDAVTASALTINMNTTASAERLYVSKTMFGGAEDITVVLSKSQALVTNSIFIGLAECDPLSGNLLLNPNIAGDFPNRGGVEFGTAAGAQTAFVQGLSDSSAAVTSISGANFAPAAMTTAFETVIEVRAEDIIASASVVDTVSGKQPAALRISSQVPNDTKAYKLIMRFKNIGTPGSNTIVTVSRIIVVDSQEMRVEIASGRGDTNSQKGVAVNLAGGALPAGSAIVGKVGVDQTTPGVTDSVSMDGFVDGVSYNNSLTGTGVFNLNGATGFNTKGADWGEVSFPSVGVGTQVVIEGSPDAGTTWYPVPCWQNASIAPPNALPVFTIFPTVFTNWVFPIQFPLQRIRDSAYTSGTISAYLMLKRGALPPMMVQQTVDVTVDSSARILAGVASGVLKASGGVLKGLLLQNTNAAVRYFQIYNKATAGIPGTDTPILTIPIALTSIAPPITGLHLYGAAGLSWAVTSDFAGATIGAAGDIVGTGVFN